MLSIAICTFNRATQLRHLLHNLASLTGLSERVIEILLIDNNSSDDTADVVREFESSLPIHYYFEAKQGLANARNRALKECKGSAIWFLDDDTCTTADSLAAYCHALSRYSDYEYFGGPIVVDWQQQKPKWLTSDNLVILQGLFGAYRLHDKEVDYQLDSSGPYGANFVVRRSLFSRLGGFNPDLGVKGDELGRGEESEFFARALHAGAKGRYLPQAIVYHRFQQERIGVRYLYRYGKAKGNEEVLLQGRGATTWVGEASNQFCRGLYQLLVGRRGNFYQCVVNVGIARGRFLATKMASSSADNAQ